MTDAPQQHTMTNNTTPACYRAMHYLIESIMFVDMIFVYDELDKAADSIDMNRLELTSSESSLVIW